MPELPEVEILVRHLAPLLKNKTVRAVAIRHAKLLRPTTERRFTRTLIGAEFVNVTRRGKYLLFTMRHPGAPATFSLLGHLGMTGRMYLQPAAGSVVRHAVAVLSLGKEDFVFEDARRFGRLTLDIAALNELGPEPLGEEFSVDYFAHALKRSAQAIKIKLLDQSLIAGVGNIYASEALFLAGISPRLAARRLTMKQVERLRRSVREVLVRAIGIGSTVPLNWNGRGENDGLFYYGREDGRQGDYEERLLVYDRENQPCAVCRTRIKRIVQAARSTFYCPRCQRNRIGGKRR